MPLNDLFLKKCRKNRCINQKIGYKNETDTNRNKESKKHRNFTKI